MSDLDLVRSIYTDWERGAFSRTDWADPQIEFDVIGSVGAREPTKGLAGMYADRALADLDLEA